MMDVILHHANTNVNAVDAMGRTCLFNTCDTRTPCLEMIRKLLTHQANVNISDSRRVTPLIKTASLGNVPVLKLLVEAGANIYAENNNGDTALTSALFSDENTHDAFAYLLALNARMKIPRFQILLLSTFYRRPEFVDVWIPFCKYEKDFIVALTGAVTTNRIVTFQKVIQICPKITDSSGYNLLSIVMDKGSAAFFDVLWANVNRKFYTCSQNFIKLFRKIFFNIAEVSFIESSLKTVINTPNFNCNFVGHNLMIRRIFQRTRYFNNTNYDWDLCKATLLAFCEFINKQGIKLYRIELVTFISYFKSNCQFINELVMLFLKYDSDLFITTTEVINFADHLNVTSQLLYICSDFQPQLIYNNINLNRFSVDVLNFFVQRFTPTKTESEMITHLSKFASINIDSLGVPSLKELARNAFRTRINNELREIMQNLSIPRAIEDILYFKTAMNDI